MVWFRRLLTFHPVLLSWIFFRARSLADAVYIFQQLLTPFELRPGYGMGIDRYQAAIAVSAVLILMSVDLFLSRRGPEAHRAFPLPVWARWAAYYALGFSILMFGRLGGSEFIYFQF
jgi:hypothetical protein